MRKLLLEARDLNSELNRLYKVYGKKLDESFERIGYLAYRHIKEKQDAHVAFNIYVSKALAALGYADGEVPYCLEYIVRLMIEGSEYIRYENENDGFLSKMLRKHLDYFEEAKNKGWLKRLGLSCNILDYDLKSLWGLEDEIESHPELNPMYLKMRSLGDQYAEVYRDDNAVIYVVYTWEADRVLGGNTAWCTVGNFRYNIGYGGSYYIICHLDSRGLPIFDYDRIQFHFADGGSLYACDVDDDAVDLDEIRVRFGASVEDAVIDIEERYRNQDLPRGGLRNIKNHEYVFKHYCDNMKFLFGIDLTEFMRRLSERVGMRFSGINIKRCRARETYDGGGGMIYDIFLNNGMCYSIYFFDYATDGVYFEDAGLNMDKNSFKNEFKGDVNLLIRELADIYMDHNM